jgi:hypothetical protein
MGVLGRDELVLPQRDALDDRAEVEAAVDAGALVAVLVQDAAHDAVDVALVEDREALADAERVGLLAHHRGAEAVEGRELERLGRLLADHLLQALAHLVGGLVGEAERDDAAGRDAALEQVDDAVGDDPGLARAGAREHEERPLGGEDRGALIGVEAAEIHRGTGSYAWTTAAEQVLFRDRRCASLPR